MWSALAPIVWGASLVIAENPAPAALVAALDEQRIGYAALVPALLGPMVDVPGAADRAYPALRLLHTGSAPATARTLRRAAGGVPLRARAGLRPDRDGRGRVDDDPGRHRARPLRPSRAAGIGRPGAARHADPGRRRRGPAGAGGHRRRGRGARAAADDRLRRAPGRDARRPAPRVAAHRRRRPPRPRGLPAPHGPAGRRDRLRRGERLLGRGRAGAVRASGRRRGGRRRRPRRRGGARPCTPPSSCGPAPSSRPTI